MKKSKKVQVVRNNTDMQSSIAYYDGSSLSNSTYMVLKVYKVYDSGKVKDQKDPPDYDYYGIYVSAGTVCTQSGNSSTNIGTLTLEFPSMEKAYFSVAWLTCASGSVKIGMKMGEPQIVEETTEETTTEEKTTEKVVAKKGKAAVEINGIQMNAKVGGKSNRQENMEFSPPFWYNT